jgi:hypothetical protein
LNQGGRLGPSDKDHGFKPPEKKRTAAAVPGPAGCHACVRRNTQRWCRLRTDKRQFAAGALPARSWRIARLCEIGCISVPVMSIIR